MIGRLLYLFFLDAISNLLFNFCFSTTGIWLPETVQSVGFFKKSTKKLSCIDIERTRTKR